MKTIEVTVEVKRRYTEQITISDEDYEAFLAGDLDELEIPEIDWGALFTECRTGDAWEETDYSICDEDGETVVNWND